MVILHCPTAEQEGLDVKSGLSWQDALYWSRVCLGHTKKDRVGERTKCCFGFGFSTLHRFPGQTSRILCTHTPGPWLTKIGKWAIVKCLKLLLFTSVLTFCQYAAPLVSHWALTHLYATTCSAVVGFLAGLPLFLKNQSLHRTASNHIWTLGEFILSYCKIS